MSFIINDAEEYPMIYFGGGGPDTVQYIVGANGVLHPSATFTRASAGTTEITQGVFSQAAVNEPRYQWAGGKRGLLIEPAATNLLFPSAIAQTMSVAVTAQSYALSFFGTGSVTLSGVSAGVVAGTGTTLKEFTFTPTAGTLTLTVSGSVTQWQLESGIKATSRIITTSAAATRAPDFPTIDTPSFGFVEAGGTFICEYIKTYTGDFSGLVMGNKSPGESRFLYLAASGQGGSYDGTTINVVSVPTTKTKLAMSYGAGNSLVSANGSVARSDLFAPTNWPMPSICIGRNINGEWLNGVIFSLPHYPRKYTAAELQAAST